MFFFFKMVLTSRHEKCYFESSKMTKMLDLTFSGDISAFSKNVFIEDISVFSKMLDLTFYEDISVL